MGNIWCRGFPCYSQFFVKDDFVIDRVECIHEICTHIGVCCFIYLFLNVWFWIKDDCDQSGMYETRKQILYKNELKSTYLCTWV